jgi:uncharacterized OB-fold protein
VSDIPESALIPAEGPIGPFVDGLDEPYWTGLREGEVRIQRCSSCRTWIWAPQWRCSACGGYDLEWEAVEPKATVFSWCRTFHGFAPSLKAFLPYVTLLAELPQAGGRRLLGILVGPQEGLKIGAELEGVIQPASEVTSNWPVLRWRMASGVSR